VIATEPGASEEELRTFLYGSAWSALLHQRGALALHAAAVETTRGAALIAGESGSGKSTLLAALLRRGFRMMADDLVSVTLDREQVPLAHPGFSGIKLWADAAAKLGCDTTGLARVRPRLEKYVVPTRSTDATGPRPVAAVYVLTSHNGTDIRLETLSASACFDAVHAQIRIPRAIRGLSSQVHHFKTTAAITNHATVVRVGRPREPFLLDQLAERVAQDLS
jgi:hypothetical protein